MENGVPEKEEVYLLAVGLAECLIDLDPAEDSEEKKLLLQVYSYIFKYQQEYFKAQLDESKKLS